LRKRISQKSAIGENKIDK